MNLGWCPTCREHTVLDVGQDCAWCETPIIRKRGGWKRADRVAMSRISPVQAQVIGRAHAGGTSLRELGRMLWQKLGYASAHSCAIGIEVALRREGLPVRGRSAATAAANRARSKRLPGEDKCAYKRRVRRERGYRDSRTGEWRVVAQEAA